LIENTILSHLVFNEEFSRKVLPFIRDDYFTNASESLVFNLITAFTLKFNKPPTREALKIELDNRDKVPEMLHKEAHVIIDNLSVEATNEEWLIEQTEQFCQKRALYNGIMKSIAIMDGSSPEGEGAIPRILTEALAVCFDPHIGHDYLPDSETRYEFYHKKEDRIPCDLDFFNKIMAGGVLRKTLNILLAGTGVGKTLVMCHLAAAYMMAGYNVLYITMEMAEERIAERIDANILDVPLDELKTIPKDMYDKKIARVRGKTSGRLIIKEYPTAAAGVGHFRHLTNELRLKKNFVADVIFVDYINICTSVRIKPGQNANSYTLVKSIAEELRGLAVELNVPVWSATQTNRAGFGDGDPGLDNTSESFGLPMTADFFLAAIRSEELDALNQIMFKQLKNRYDDMTKNLRFVCGVERSKMRLYDVEQSAQDGVVKDQPDVSVFDKGDFGNREIEDKKSKWKKINV